MDLRTLLEQLSRQGQPRSGLVNRKLSEVPERTRAAQEFIALNSKAAGAPRTPGTYSDAGTLISYLPGYAGASGGTEFGGGGTTGVGGGGSAPGSGNNPGTIGGGGGSSAGGGSTAGGGGSPSGANNNPGGGGTSGSVADYINFIASQPNIIAEPETRSRSLNSFGSGSGQSPLEQAVTKISNPQISVPQRAPTAARQLGTQQLQALWSQDPKGMSFEQYVADYRSRFGGKLGMLA